MSKQTEARIIRGLGTLAAHVSAGDTPTDALTKVARELQLTPGHTRLMGYAYNTARTTQQRETAASLGEKTAAFDMADPEAAVAAIYGEIDKTAAELHHRSAVSAEYTLPPTWYGRQYTLRAAASIPLTEKAAQQPSLADAWADAERRQREVDGLRVTAVGLSRQLHEAFGKMAEYFSLATAVPYDDVVENVQLYGDDAEQAAITYLSRLAPQRAKQANCPEHEVHWEQAPYSLIRKCAALGRQAAAADEVYQQRLDEHLQTSLTQLAATVPNWPAAPSVLDGVPQSAEKTAAAERPRTFQTALSITAAQKLLNALGAALDSPAPEELVNRQLSVLRNPEHDALLRQISTRANLQDLLAHDDVLAQHDPTEVANAFNDLGKLSPRAVEQPAVLQAALRKRVQHGALEPFDADQLLSAETRLKGLQQVEPKDVATKPKSSPAK